MAIVTRETLFRIFAVSSLAAAAYHVAIYVHPAFSSGGSPARHAVFAVIDTICAYLFLRRPLWFVLVFAAVAAEAIWSHGRHAWQILQNEERYDWPSIAVVLLVPISLMFLVHDAWLRRRA